MKTRTLFVCACGMEFDDSAEQAQHAETCESELKQRYNHRTVRTCADCKYKDGENQYGSKECEKLHCYPSSRNICDLFEEKDGDA